MILFYSQEKEEEEKRNRERAKQLEEEMRKKVSVLSLYNQSLKDLIIFFLKTNLIFSSARRRTVSNRGRDERTGETSSSKAAESRTSNTERERERFIMCRRTA